MGRRTLVELLHVAAGVMAAVAIAAACAWAYPLGHRAIWWCGAAAAAATMAMGVGPLRRAWIADRAGAGEARP